MHHLHSFAGLFLLTVVAGCAPGLAGTPAAGVRSGYTQVGLASWYGREQEGTLTASGERFRMHDLTAAHRTLPLGTRVLVENLGNGRRVVVRINDRGPYAHGRILDVSLGAARALGMVEAGVARVRIVVVAAGPSS